MNLRWKEWIVSLEYTFITTKTMEKQCCICRANFIPTNLNAETRHCCKQCIKELNN